MPLEPTGRTGKVNPMMSAPHTKSASNRANPATSAEPAVQLPMQTQGQTQGQNPAQKQPQQSMLSPGATLDNNNAGRTRADRWAIGLSALCLAHCLAIPVALLLFPVMAHNLIDHQSWVHWSLLALALPLSAYALVSGYRNHRYRPVLALGGLGISCMFVGVGHLAGVAWELPLTVLGATLLAYAHVENMRRSHA